MIHRQFLVGLLGLGLLLWWGSLTRERAFVWQTDEAIWTEAVRVSPTRLRARVNLAVAVQQRGDAERAMALYQEVLTLAADEGIRRNPLDRLVAVSLARAHLAFLVWRQGDLAMAQFMAQRILIDLPHFGQAHYILGLVALGRGDCEASMQHFIKAAADPMVSGTIPPCRGEP